MTIEKSLFCALVFFVTSLFPFLFLYKWKNTRVYFSVIIRNIRLNILFYNTHDTMEDICVPSLLDLNEVSWRKL